MGKKPFSNKKKKAQLQAKRKRKAEQAEHKARTFRVEQEGLGKGKGRKDDEEEDGSEGEKRGNKNVIIVNLDEFEKDGVTMKEDSQTETNTKTSSTMTTGSSRGRKGKVIMDTYKTTSVSNRHNEKSLRTEFEKESRDEVDKRKKKMVIPYEYVGEDMVTERGGIRFDPTTVAGLTEDSPEVIDMPKRPPFEKAKGAQALEKNERKYFKTWLWDVKNRYGSEALNNFEHNLEVWRQLWRVVEKSDVLLLMTDIRHPIYNFPVALYRWVAEELGKPMVLVLNKIDLVSQDVVLGWRDFFNEHFPEMVVTWFSAFPKEGSVTDQEADALQKRKAIDRHRKWKSAGVKRLLKVCKEMGIEGKENDYVTIGTLGNPNTGKSTLINGLVGRKVVSASRQPGHTKHFQTYFISDELMLCDCPGLVFPSIDVGRPEQVLFGSFPIAQLREPFSSLRYVGNRIRLEEVYGLDMTHEDVAYNGETEWSPFLTCGAYAVQHGYRMEKSGNPDIYRAAREILWDVVDGRVVMHIVPPQFVDGATDEEFFEEGDGNEDDEGVLYGDDDEEDWGWQQVQEEEEEEEEGEDEGFEGNAWDILDGFDG